MATTSLWRVKGWLGKVVVYVENPDKTENPACYEAPTQAQKDSQGLADVISYAVNDSKTEDRELMQRFVSGVNCHPSTARTEMIAVKKRFGKEDGTIAYHGYQSFAPGEVTPEMAHEIGVKLAQQLWGSKYQVLVATHLDKESHLHNHFVVNTVSFVDGKKYFRSGKDYYEMRRVSDELCREYRLSVIDNPQPGKTKQHGEWRAEWERKPTWRGIIRYDVDDAIREARTERQFFEALHKKGYEVKVGKDISVRPPGKERFVRLTRNFGEDYTLESIRRKILEQPVTTRPLPEPPPRPQRYRLSGNWQKRKKATGFRALYFHYCYLLGVFPKNKSQPKHNIHFLLKEDLIKLDQITQEARLLARCHIDTGEQLAAYRSDLENQITERTAQRRTLYKQQRTVAVKSDEGRLAEVKAEITQLSGELGRLRQELKLCDGIAQRSGILPEKLQTVRKDDQPERKEKTRYGKFR